jgi:hypothetical protein
MKEKLDKISRLDKSRSHTFASFCWFFSVLSPRKCASVCLSEQLAGVGWSLPGVLVFAVDVCVDALS